MYIPSCDQFRAGHFSASTSAFVLTWAMSRLRLPVDAVLLIYAAMAIAIATLIERWRR